MFFWWRVGQWACCCSLVCESFSLTGLEMTSSSLVSRSLITISKYGSLHVYPTWGFIKLLESVFSVLHLTFRKVLAIISSNVIFYPFVSLSLPEKSHDMYIGTWFLFQKWLEALFILRLLSLFPTGHFLLTCYRIYWFCLLPSQICCWIHLVNFSFQLYLLTLEFPFGSFLCFSFFCGDSLFIWVIVFIFSFHYLNFLNIFIIADFEVFVSKIHPLRIHFYWLFPRV